MPILVLKTQGGISYPLSNGKSLNLRGFGLINNVDSALWNECKNTYKQAIEQLTSDGFLIVSDSENNVTKNATADTMQQALDKQNKDIENNTQDIIVDSAGKKSKVGKVKIVQG